MKTITVRDVRQRWPDAERALETEREIIITRDGKPVARLLAVETEETARPRFDPEENRRWQEETFGKGVMFDTLTGLLEDREERKLI
jgi:antitoxin (DNA-binding transcriptional repressor) of toxin-antitoxin stability system